jgi:hypothetical protein
MLASRGGLAQRVGEILEYLFGYKPACRSTIERVNAGIRLDKNSVEQTQTWLPKQMAVLVKFKNVGSAVHI